MPNPAWVQSRGPCGRREIEAEIDSVEIGRHPALADLAAQSLKAPQEEEGRGGCCGGGGGGGYPNPLLHQVGVLVRRQWTLDLRDFGYKFTWVGFSAASSLAPFLEEAGSRRGTPLPSGPQRLRARPQRLHVPPRRAGPLTQRALGLAL